MGAENAFSLFYQQPEKRGMTYPLNNNFPVNEI